MSDDKNTQGSGEKDWSAMTDDELLIAVGKECDADRPFIPLRRHETYRLLMMAQKAAQLERALTLALEQQCTNDAEAQLETIEEYVERERTRLMEEAAGNAGEERNAD